jgi:hypothetical protein
VLVLMGLLFSGMIYPVTTSLWHPSPSDDMGDTMMMSLYFTLGIFLLIAVRNPAAKWESDCLRRVVKLCPRYCDGGARTPECE